jgi:hypothetical protein
MNETTNRPLNVTILSVFVLCITSWNVLRSYSAIVNWDILREFGANPVYILLTGLLWSAAGLWLTYQIWTGRRAAFRAGMGISGLYFLWYWFDRLVIQPSPAPNAIFSAVVSTVYLAYIIISLIASKAFFDKERG